MHEFNITNFTNGFRRIIIGLFKKIVIADRVAFLVNTVYNDPYNYEGPQFILATLFFAIQIYCDFSGYSDIAIGSARIWGLSLFMLLFALACSGGLFTFNVGSIGQQMDSSYFLIQDISTKNKPDIIIIDVYWKTLENEFTFSQLVRIYEKLQNPAVKRSCFRECFPLKSKIEYSLDILRYRHDFYWFLDKFAFKLLVNRDDETDRKVLKQFGHIYSDKIISQSLIKETNRFRNCVFTEFNEIQLEYMAKLINFCKEKNVTVVYVSVPLLYESLELIELLYNNCYIINNHVDKEDTL